MFLAVKVQAPTDPINTGTPPELIAGPVVSVIVVAAIVIVLVIFLRRRYVYYINSFIRKLLKRQISQSVMISILAL